MYNTSKETAAIKKEIEIRGRYLMMACDIEFSLLNIIMFCNPDPYNHERLGQFTEMNMAGKINNAISDLKKYKKEYYLEFQNDFEGLEEFRIVRNDMAHYVGLFPNEPDLSVFKIDYIDKDGSRKDVNNKKEYMKNKEYTDQYILESLNRFATINNHLATLWFRLKNEFEFSSNNPPLIHPTK